MEFQVIIENHIIISLDLFSLHSGVLFIMESCPNCEKLIKTSLFCSNSNLYFLFLLLHRKGWANIIIITSVRFPAVA